jgi:hypothetical protein
MNHAPTVLLRRNFFMAAPVKGSLATRRFAFQTAWHAILYRVIKELRHCN